MTLEEYLNQVKAELGSAWLPNIYRDRIQRMRTRSYHFEGLKKNARVEIHHTLLGVELKIRNRRLLCPDLANARYLAVFARAGCEAVAVPYDITKVSQLADELESSWQRMLLLVEHKTRDKSVAFRGKLRGLLIAAIREEIGVAGAGQRMPGFLKSTKQRG
ncbi:MAG TPA: hypothetical protein VIB00_07625 [Pyrinomonadaceae bacterium]|jgi:hypothetical protein